MSVTKLPSGKWLCECYPFGKAAGKRVRKQFATKGEALSRERKLLAQRNKTEVEIGAVTLAELVLRWYDLHGKTLQSGESRLAKLEAICKRLGDPLAHEVDKNMFAVYRERRLSGEWLAKGRKTVKEATVFRKQSYLDAVFSELKRLGECVGGNPLDGIRQFKKGDQELSFIYEDEIKRLLAACDESENKSLGLIVRVCLATGSRWGEAESMKQSQVLPTGQRTHVLRHTFVSHFMMGGSNILVLQQILNSCAE